MSSLSLVDHCQVCDKTEVCTSIMSRNDVAKYLDRVSHDVRVAKLSCIVIASIRPRIGHIIKAFAGRSRKLGRRPMTRRRHCGHSLAIWYVFLLHHA